MKGAFSKTPLTFKGSLNSHDHRYDVLSAHFKSACSSGLIFSHYFSISRGGLAGGNTRKNP